MIQIMALEEAMQIESPEDLWYLIRVIKRSISEGKLQQYTPFLAPLAANVAISDLEENKPWPADYIELYFMTTDGKQKFRLALEVHHGIGGDWSPL